MCRRRNATPCGLATFGLFLVGALFLVSSCPAQVPDPINAAQSPMPGSEHHYIGMGGEIVNPVDGSVSFNLPIQLPSGRGLNMPFGIRYTGAEQRYLANNPTSGGNVFWKPWYFLTGETNLQVNGWSYDIPWLTFQARAIAQVYNPSKQATSVCIGIGNYVFQGFDSAQRTLTAGATYEDPQNNSDTICPTTIQAPGSLHGVLGTTTDLATFQQGIPNSAPVTVVDQSGTSYQFSSGGTSLQGYLQNGSQNQNAAQLATSVIDRNGNIISLNGTKNGYIDTLGRTVVSWSGIGNNGDTITVPGLASSIVLKWANVTASAGGNVSGRVASQSSNYVGCGGTTGSQTLSEINEIDIPGYPTTQKYLFTYDSTYGRISKLVFPGGGYVRYVWGVNSQSAITYQAFTNSVGAWEGDGTMAFPVKGVGAK